MSGPAPASAFVPAYLATSSAHPVPHVVDRHTRRIVAAFGLGPDGDVVDRTGPDGMPGEGSFAYARLFAAAPDLYAAAQAALACIEKHVPAETFAPREWLRSALRKADGIG